MLEEKELEGALVVADDRLTVRPRARLGDAHTHLAGLLESLGVGRDVEDVNAAVLGDFLVIEPLCSGRYGKCQQHRSRYRHASRAQMIEHPRHTKQASSATADAIAMNVSVPGGCCRRVAARLQGC